MYVIRPMCRLGGARSVGAMKTILALLSAAVVLAVAAPAGAMPIDNHRSTPTRTAPTAAPAPAPSPSSGAETWVVIAVAALAFGAGAAAARLAPALRIRSAS
jgi:hypothetical protein